MNPSEDPWTWRVSQRALSEFTRHLSEAIKAQQDAFFLLQAKFDVDAERNREQFDERQRRKGRPAQSADDAEGDELTVGPTSEFSPVSDDPTAHFRSTVQAQLAREEERHFLAEEAKAKSEFLAQMEKQLPLAFLSFETQFAMEHELNGILQRNLLRVAVAKKQLVDSGIADTADRILAQTQHPPAASRYGGGHGEQNGQAISSSLPHSSPKRDSESAVEQTAVKNEHPQSPIGTISDGDGDDGVSAKKRKEEDAALSPSGLLLAGLDGGAKAETSLEAEEAGTVVRAHPHSHDRQKALRYISGRGAMLIPEGNGKAAAISSRAPLYPSPGLTKVILPVMDSGVSGVMTGEGDGMGAPSRATPMQSTNQRARRLLQQAQPLLSAFVDAAMEGNVQHFNHLCTLKKESWEHEVRALSRQLAAENDGEAVRDNAAASTTPFVSAPGQRSMGLKAQAKERLEQVQRKLSQLQAELKIYNAACRTRGEAQKKTVIPAMVENAARREEGREFLSDDCSLGTVTDHSTHESGIGADRDSSKTQRVMVPTATPDPPAITADDVDHIFVSLAEVPTSASIDFFGATPISPEEEKRLVNLPSTSEAVRQTVKVDESSSSSNEDTESELANEEVGHTARHQQVRYLEELLKLPDETPETDTFIQRRYLWPSALEEKIAHRLSGSTALLMRLVNSEEKRQRQLRVTPDLPRERLKGRRGWTPLMMSAADLGDVFMLALVHEVNAQSAPCTDDGDTLKLDDKKTGRTSVNARKRSRASEVGDSLNVDGEMSEESVTTLNAGAHTLDYFSDKSSSLPPPPLSMATASHAASLPLRKDEDSERRKDSLQVRAALAACYRAACTSEAAKAQEKRHKAALPGGRKWGCLDCLGAAGNVVVASVFDPNFPRESSHRAVNSAEAENAGPRLPEETSESTATAEGRSYSAPPFAAATAATADHRMSTMQLAKRVVDKRFPHVNLPRSAGAAVLQISGAGEFAASVATLTSTFVAPPRNEAVQHRLMELEYEL